MAAAVILVISGSLGDFSGGFPGVGFLPTAEAAPADGQKSSDPASAARPYLSPYSGRLAPKGRITTLAACEPGARGKDYQVGSAAGQLATLDKVPWASLRAGDTVRIFYQAAPHVGKVLLTANGTAAAPVRVCGVKGPNGERPIVDAAGAVTRRGLSYGSPSAAAIQESRAVFMVKNNDEYTHFPTHIQIDGLVIRGANPANRFIDSNGASKQYDSFGACIWIDRGQNITIADNEITDCTMGVFSRSTDDGAFAVTRNIKLIANYIHGNGVAESDRIHNTYLQSVGVLYEFNFYGPLRKNAWGAALKDRSVGTVIRFNRIEEGARSIDLVEAEDFADTALPDPAYRTAYVYGNQIVKSGDTGSFFHYGGDHYDSKPGANWGEPLFRKGTLYFFNNTVHVAGKYTVLFNLSTTEEKAEVWNNVFYFESSAQWPSMRQNTDIGSYWTAGGILNLGRNWINSNWVDFKPGDPVPGKLNGKANLITGNTPPFDLNTLAPVPGGPIVDAAQPPPVALAGHEVNFQLDANFLPQPRRVSGSAPDLGAIER